VRFIDFIEIITMGMRSKSDNKRSPKALKPTYMNFLLKIISWKKCLAYSLAIIAALIVLNFYGLYSNKFYFFKIDNYIFPLLAIVHFTYLYVLWFKIREKEFSDPQMRNLEYAMYAVLLIYAFRFFESIYVLISYGEYADHIVPATFMPMALLIISLQFLLLLFTVTAFAHRKDKVGPYNIDNFNENIDSWQ